MKIRVGVFFGGKSVEHEVSIISALQACNSINKDKYEVVPVYITKNGTGDLAVMSIETYERLVGRFELYSLMEKGINDVEQGRVQNADDAFARIEQKLGQGKDG